MHKCTLRCYWDLWQLFITNRGPCCRDMSHMCRFSLSYLQCVFIVWVNVTINLCVMCIKCPEYRVLLPAEVSLWKPCRFFRDYLTCRFMHFEWRLSPQLWSLSLSLSPTFCVTTLLLSVTLLFCIPASLSLSEAWNHPHSPSARIIFHPSKRPQDSHIHAVSVYFSIHILRGEVCEEYVSEFEIP